MVAQADGRKHDIQQNIAICFVASTAQGATQHNKVEFNTIRKQYTINVWSWVRLSEGYEEDRFLEVPSLPPQNNAFMKSGGLHGKSFPGTTSTSLGLNKHFQDAIHI